MLRRFIVLDMDRTLLNTEHYGELLMDAFGLSDAERKRVRVLLAKNTGSNFDLLAHVSEGRSVSVDQAKESMLKKSKETLEKLLLPGVRDLFQVLKETRDAHGILTTGTPENQSLKLALLRHVLGESEVSLPAEITSVPNKSATFALDHWRPRQKAFYIGPVLSGVRGGCYASRLIMVDDKHGNLSTPHVQIVALHVPVTPSHDSHTLHSVAMYIRHTAP